MDKGYEVYCFWDRHFYDSPIRSRHDDVDFPFARAGLPEGWQRVEMDDWLVCLPDGARFAAQGWKIHVSACLDNAEEILVAVSDYCLGRQIPFKFIRSLRLVHIRNMKYADRSASGKFVTIYPDDEQHLEIILTELGGRLAGYEGPYILSDLRFADGPLYVRYGGFAERYCIGPDGKPQLAIEDGDGVLVPDRREPSFTTPEWVRLPEFLAPHLAARNSATVEDVPYRIDAAIHFSNGGGLYEAVDRRSGERVILKEGRPHAGLATDGADAVSRLRREHDNLQRLAGLDCVPAVRDFFTLGGHQFLALERIDGKPLRSVLVERFPLLDREVDELALADYTAWALNVYDQVERAVTAVHNRGIVILDHHPFNVLVKPDGQIVLIDFEIAGDVEEGRQATLADPAFAAPGDRVGFDIDKYSLACLRLFMFLPLTTMLWMDPNKAAHLAWEITKVFPVTPELLDDAVRTITGRDEPWHDVATAWPTLETDHDGWPHSRASMAGAILASATPDREDRLFPGDVRQFHSGGLNLAYGAAGVLYTLNGVGCGRYPAHEDWLVEQALRAQPGALPGFYDGLHGVAFVLDELGRREDALAVFDVCARRFSSDWESLALDLYGGLAGIGLNVLHFAGALDDSALHEGALRVADIIAERLGGEDSVGTVSGGHNPFAGLLRGSSGPALFFLRLYERTGENGLLDLAATALRQDLRRCVLRQEGSLQVDEGWRTMPYIGEGSAGIGMVLDDYLRQRHDEHFAQAVLQIERAAQGQFYLEPGLFYGRAGLILFLTRRSAPGQAASDPVISGHLRRLAWHSLTYQDHLAFPGEQLLRLSMDLGSGTAGVLLASAAALQDPSISLPFLKYPVSARRAAGQDSVAIGPRGR